MAFGLAAGPNPASHCVPCGPCTWSYWPVVGELSGLEKLEPWDEYVGEDAFSAPAQVRIEAADSADTDTGTHHTGPAIEEKEGKPAVFKRSVVLVLDNDETVGSWGDLSVLYSWFLKKGLRPSPAFFAEMAKVTMCARPGLREFFDAVLELKRGGHICAVVMCTAASNWSGWVTFLKSVLETLYGQPVYDHVIAMEGIRDWHVKRGTQAVDPATGTVVKDMHMVREVVGVDMDAHVVAVDDLPFNIRNGAAIAAPPYRVAVNLVELARTYLDRWWTAADEAVYKEAFMVSWRRFERDPGFFSGSTRDDFMVAADFDDLPCAVRALHEHILAGEGHQPHQLQPRLCCGFGIVSEGRRLSGLMGPMVPAGPTGPTVPAPFEYEYQQCCCSSSPGSPCSPSSDSSAPVLHSRPKDE